MLAFFDTQFGFLKSGRRTWRRKSIKIYILWHRHTAFPSAFFTKVLFSNEAKHLKQSRKSHKNVNQIQIDSSSVFLQFGQTLQAMQWFIINFCNISYYRYKLQQSYSGGQSHKRRQMIIFTTTSRPWSIVHRYVQRYIETVEKLAKSENLKVKCVFSILNEILY